jgi:hypothetical protein
MAFPLPRGVTASEIAFLAEMETVTIVPRQRLEGLELLGVSRHAHLLPVQESNNTRAPSKHSSLQGAHPYPSGSPSSSNANAAPTSSPHHGCTQSN